MARELPRESLASAGVPIDKGCFATEDEWPAVRPALSREGDGLEGLNADAYVARRGSARRVVR